MSIWLSYASVVFGVLLVIAAAAAAIALHGLAAVVVILALASVSAGGWAALAAYLAPVHGDLR